MSRISSSGSNLSSSNSNSYYEKKIELQKLQREYRLTKNDRDAYTEESQNSIKKQNVMINYLKDDIQKLEMKKKILSDRIYSRNKYETDKDVKTLSDYQDKLVEQQKKIYEYIEETDKKIEEMNQKIMTLKKEQGGINKFEENHEHINKTIKILQNKLEQSLKKFNTTLVENRKNREKLDYYRKERNVFYNIINKLIKDIKDKKNHINNIIESSTSAYQTRDEANCKISILKEKSEKELYQHSQEINELSRLLDHEQKTRDFINTKNAERKIVPEKTRSTNKKTVNQDDPYNNIENYQKTLDKIYESTKMNDINELIANFNETEEENFSLFNYVTEVIGEVGDINKEIKDISQNIENLKIQNVEIEDKRKVTISKLEMLQKKKYTQYENNYIDCNRSLNILKDKVFDIMKVIQTFKPVKKIYVPPELPNKHYTADTENQENEDKSSKNEENENKENDTDEIAEIKSRDIDSGEEEGEGEENKKITNNNENEEKSKDDIDTVKFELPVNLEIKDKIQDVNLMQCLNYIEENINNLLMINYTINLSNVINNNQQAQRNSMVDSNPISNKIESETTNDNSHLPNNQEINSLLGIGPLPPVTYNGVNVPILSDDFDLMQKSSVSKNALIVDKKNDKFNDSHPMSREELMKINMSSIKEQEGKNTSIKLKNNSDSTS
ncbi:hypothetical protein BCR32DRAFT_327649 [Anaeromyces robustus]|uniref:ODAD1 central coiled coil region domain-containing protein n=1 Tax=Anaeromyces robustus TaxID=1754192 RepID=A0A1Y1X496_9FUNG|nr:hypothetical protein BCR32DRAFT_327649 [Anaeromyces robustus]|eukprot:ORX80629.1 hypothetical protein BCR32DRAFT_327649 [Anaeromyces robustus]